MEDLFKKLQSQLNPTLYGTALIHLVLAVVFLLLSFIDTRYVLGIPLWYKPFKFAISIAVYTATLAYLVPFLPSRVIRNTIAFGTSVAMFVEMVLIALQAGRGTLSHYNYEDAFGIIVYSVMGVFIGIASILLIVLGIGLLRDKPEAWSKSFRQATQIGIWLTVFGTIIGGYMSSKLGHTMGGPDGGAGLPLLNWSTKLGDWRVPHFIGLHALQVFLLVGWLLRKNPLAQLLQWVSFIVYSAVLVATVLLTLQGTAMFDTMYHGIKFLHIVAGFSALLLFWIPIVVTKGSKIHNRVGWAYVVSMSVVAISAWYMAFWRIVLDPDRNAESFAFACFLIFIAILSAVTAWFGIRALYNHRQKLRVGIIDLAASTMLLGSGLGLCIYGFTMGNPLISWFPLIGVSLGVQQLYYWLSPPRNRHSAIIAHLQGLLACSISTLTAFTVFGAPRLLSLDGQVLWLWLAPTLLINPIIIYFIRKYQKKAAA